MLLPEPLNDDGKAEEIAALRFPNPSTLPFTAGDDTDRAKNEDAADADADADSDGSTPRGEGKPGGGRRRDGEEESVR